MLKKILMKAKSLTLFSTLLSASLLSNTTVHAADGDLDTTFGNGGVQIVDVGQGTSTVRSCANAMALQQDGKIVVAGFVANNSDKSNFGVARLNTNGTPDASFDGDGKLIVSMGGVYAVANAIALQPDGKIIVVGSAQSSTVSGWAIVRLNADGSFDNSFDTDGKLILSGLHSAYAVAVQGDGKILVAGSGSSSHHAAVARLNADGSFDNFPGFGPQLIGFAGASNAAVTALALQSDGKIIVGGHGNGSFVIRLNTDGTMDNSFDSDGQALISTVGNASALALQSNGKIVIAGVAVGNGGLPHDFAAARLNADGTMDTSFDGDGSVTVPLSNDITVATGVVVQSDGKTVIAGYTDSPASTGTGRDMAAVRLNSDGSLDSSFSGDGKAIVPIGATASYDLCNAISLQKDGKILLAGCADNPNENIEPSFTVVRLIGYNPVLAVNNPRTFAEGSAATPNSTAFTISLSTTSTQTVTVNYKTTDGVTNGAKAGSDYIAKSGTLTFAPGETEKFVRVNFIGDNIAELNETFFLDLKTPANASISDSRGSAYIGNDDGPTISIANAATVNEGNSNTTPQTFIVTLSAASPNIVTVNWSTANNTAGPADYVAASGTLSFAPGQTSQTITVQVKGDTVVEPNETYRVNLSNPKYAVLADSQGVAYILNDDTATGTTKEPSK